jgi:hypothetical protein
MLSGHLTYARLNRRNIAYRIGVWLVWFIVVHIECLGTPYTHVTLVVEPMEN